MVQGVQLFNQGGRVTAQLSIQGHQGVSAELGDGPGPYCATHALQTVQQRTSLRDVLVLQCVLKLLEQLATLSLETVNQPRQVVGPLSASREFPEQGVIERCSGR